VPFIKNNIDLVLVVIVALSLVPMAIEYLRNRRQSASV
jgi:hypothetical protein